MAATLSQSLLLTVPLAPLAGAIIAGLFGKAVGRRGAHTATILGVLIAFLCSALVLKQVAVDGARFSATLYEWAVIGGLKMEVGFLVDGLTAMMMCVVTFVSLMVHVYTIGYMEQDPGYQRFFSYISLFTFSMIYTDYLYPLQLAAVLLLVAIIAAIALTLRGRKDSRHQDPSVQVKAKKADRVRIIKMPPVVEAPAASKEAKEGGKA